MAAITGIAVLSCINSTIDFPSQIPGYIMTLTNSIDAIRRSHNADWELFPEKKDDQATATFAHQTEFVRGKQSLQRRSKTGIK